jgi:hypothetical protein
VKIRRDSEMEKKLDELYFVLFNSVTSAINELNKETWHLEHVMEALKILKDAQIKTEEMYINLMENDSE